MVEGGVGGETVNLDSSGGACLVEERAHMAEEIGLEVK